MTAPADRPAPPRVPMPVDALLIGVGITVAIVVPWWVGFVHIVWLIVGWLL